MKFIVPEELDGVTLKSFLRKHCSVSARTLAKLKRTENGICRGGKVIRSIDILSAGDEIEISLPEDDAYIEPADLPVKIAYEDENVIAAVKPAGMPVHPVGEYQKNTLANAVAFHARQMGESYSFRPVNRLDKDTSGLVLCAKDRFSAAFLQGHCDKEYIALCQGKITGSGTIDKPLRIREGHSIQREIGQDGVRAVTHYRTIRNYGEDHTLVALRLETGRTHQIRAHFSGIGHPLAGDDMYGGSRDHFPRQCLHCRELSFIHPISKERITVRSEIDFFDEYTD